MHVAGCKLRWQLDQRDVHRLLLMAVGSTMLTVPIVSADAQAPDGADGPNRLGGEQAAADEAEQDADDATHNPRRQAHGRA